MSGYYINIHVKSEGPLHVRRAVNKFFAEQGFQPTGDEAAATAVEDEDTLPEGDDWYGVVVGGGTREGWTSVYVEDWKDSGVLAKGLSSEMEAAVLEVWVAEDTHWGYTYYENGMVTDRFADDPGKVAETPAEVDALRGRAEALASILRVPLPAFDQILAAAHASAGEFVGTAIDALGQAVGLPFDHIIIGYESFFDDDPEDYASGLEHWSQWRHLAFHHPEGKEQLAD